jgi:predicted enzyme related to lactoylglutathione lyase
MPPVRQVLARVFVDSIERALPLYERLAGTATSARFSFGEVELAWIGPFLLLAGPATELDRYRDRVASLIVDDIAQVATWVTHAGGQVIEGPAPAPNGARMIARHPDGAIFEYLQIDQRPSRSTDHAAS